MEQTLLPTTAEQIAGEEYPDNPDDTIVRVSSVPALERTAFINGYTRGQQDAHPKEVAPTVEETVDELMEFLEDYIDEGIEEMHDHSSDHGWQYDRGHPNWNATMDDLRTRLTKLLTTP